MGVSVIYHDGRVMLCVGPCAGASFFGCRSLEWLYVRKRLETVPFCHLLRPRSVWFS